LCATGRAIRGTVGARRESMTRRLEYPGCGANLPMEYATPSVHIVHAGFIIVGSVT
jgi:hypothetical protein